MAKINFKKFYPSYVDEDEMNYSRRTYIEPSAKTNCYSSPGLIGKRRTNPISLITFPSDGIIQRTRPTTMKNSDNGDFIICETSHGMYVAHQTSTIPRWVRELVRQIESQQN